MEDTRPKLISKKKPKKRVSKTSHSIKLFTTDLRFIRKKVKDESNSKNFKTITQAIRYYVSRGITADDATVETRNTLNNRLVKQSLFRQIQEVTAPLGEQIDALMKLVEDSNEFQKLSTTGLNNSFSKFEDKVIGNFESFKETLKTPSNSSEYDEHILKNILILRSIMYVYIMGFHGREAPSTSEDKTLWFKLVKEAHKNAGILAMSEIKMLNDEELEIEIRKYAKLIYDKAYLSNS